MFLKVGHYWIMIMTCYSSLKWYTVFTSGFHNHTLKALWSSCQIHRSPGPLPSAAPSATKTPSQESAKSGPLPVYSSLTSTTEMNNTSNHKPSNQLRALATQHTCPQVLYKRASASYSQMYCISCGGTRINVTYFVLALFSLWLTLVQVSCSCHVCVGYFPEALRFWQTCTRGTSDFVQANLPDTVIWSLLPALACMSLSLCIRNILYFEVVGWSGGFK